MSTTTVPVLPGPAIPFGPAPVPPVPSPAPPSARTLPSRRTTPRSLPRSVHLPTEGALFPWLARRFTPGEATLWIGSSPAIDRMLALLYAGSASAGGQVSLLEGANRFDPYAIAAGGRPMGVDPAVVLDRIRLARAFTAYQLVALVEGWAREVRRNPPTLLVAHELPLLFESDEVPPEERVPLLTHVSEELRHVAEAAGVPLLITVPGGPGRFPGLTRVGPRLADVVRFDARGARLSLNAYREAAEFLLLPRPGGQYGLEEFGRVVDAEVMAWDAPLRPTGRRWRNG